MRALSKCLLLATVALCLSADSSEEPSSLELDVMLMSEEEEMPDFNFTDAIECSSARVANASGHAEETYDVIREGLAKLAGKSAQDYRPGDVMRASLAKLAGKSVEDYRFGDITRAFLANLTKSARKYRFGDITRSILGKLAGKKGRDYEFGDITERALGLTHSPYKNSLQCLKHTGGTCYINECHDWRQEVKCSKGRACKCKPGFCAGSDGICYEQTRTNIVYDGNYTIRNARWPDYYLYMSRFGKLSVGKSDGVNLGTESQFKITQLFDVPGDDGFLVLLSSTKWPNHIVWPREYESCEKDKDGNQECKTEYDVIAHHINSWSGNPSPLNLGLELFSVPDQVIPKLRKDTPAGPLLMIKSPLLDRYMYIPRGSWSSSSYGGDPGFSGYWLIQEHQDSRASSHPNLENIPKFAGKLCPNYNFDCGDEEEIVKAMKLQPKSEL